MSTLSSDVSSRRIPQSVSFVTDDDSRDTDKEEFELNFEDMYYDDQYDNDDSDEIYPTYTTELLNENDNVNKSTTNDVGGTIISAMSEIGSVFFPKKEEVKDARDLRMLDSDISNSSDDDDDSTCSDSSSHQENFEDSGANYYNSPSNSLPLSCSFPVVDELEDAVDELENSFHCNKRTISKIQSSSKSNDDLATSLSMIKQHAERLGVDPTELFRINVPPTLNL